MDLFAKCDLRTNGLCQVKTCSGMLQANDEAPVLDADLNTKYQASCFLVSPPHVRMVTLPECENSLAETASANATDGGDRTSLPEDGVARTTVVPSCISEADKQDIANRTVAAIKKSTLKSVVAGYTKIGAAATRAIVEPKCPDPTRAFPFVCGYDEDEEWIEMNVYDAYNKLERRRFTIRNKKQWFYIKQLADSKKNPVKLEKYPEDERINLSAVFRELQGDDGADFYKHIYSTTGAQARYWLEQRPRR